MPASSSISAASISATFKPQAFAADNKLDGPDVIKCFAYALVFTVRPSINLCTSIRDSGRLLRRSNDSNIFISLNSPGLASLFFFTVTLTRYSHEKGAGTFYADSSSASWKNMASFARKRVTA